MPANAGAALDRPRQRRCAGRSILLVAALLWSGFARRLRSPSAADASKPFSPKYDDHRALLSKSPSSSSAFSCCSPRRSRKSDDKRGLADRRDRSFSRRSRRHFLSCAGAAGTPTGFWRFYTADPLAIFFKRFALVTTILVLVMVLDYRQSCAQVHPRRDARQRASANFTPADLHLRRPDVHGVGGRFRHDLRLARTGHDVASTSSSLSRAAIPLSLEAGVKYLILGALRTGFLVYGITWIFGVTGETNLARIDAVLSRPAMSNTDPLLFGMVLVLVALGFKIAAVPFQIWVPDVYQGAPTPVTAFLSVGSKAAGFVVLLRVLAAVFHAAAGRQRLARRHRRC